MNYFSDLLKAAHRFIGPRQSGLPKVKPVEQKPIEWEKPELPEPGKKQLEHCPFGGGIECLKHGGDGAENHFEGYRHKNAKSPTTVHKLVKQEHRDWTWVKNPENAEEHEVSKSFTVAKGVLQHLNQWTEKSFKLLSPEDQEKELDIAKQAHELMDAMESKGKINQDKSGPVIRGLEEKGRHLSLYSAEARLDKKKSLGKKNIIAIRKLKKNTNADVSVSLKVGQFDVRLTNDDHVEKVLDEALGDIDINELAESWQVNEPDFFTAINAVTITNKSVKFDGQIMSQNGEHIAVFERTAYKNEVGKFCIYHDLFMMEDEFQKGKIGTRFLRHSVQQYLQLGVRRIDTHPDQIGKYTWPRMGLNWHEDSAAFVRAKLPKYIADRTKIPLSKAKALVDKHADRAWEIACMVVPVQQPKPSGFVGPIQRMKVGKEFLLDNNYGGEMWSTSEAYVVFGNNPSFNHFARYLGLEK